jgi:hypothetical protein
VLHASCKFCISQYRGFKTTHACAIQVWGTNTYFTHEMEDCNSDASLLRTPTFGQQQRHGHAKHPSRTQMVSVTPGNETSGALTVMNVPFAGMTFDQMSFEDSSCIREAEISSCLSTDSQPQTTTGASLHPFLCRFPTCTAFCTRLVYVTV